MANQKEANSWYNQIYNADIVDLCDALGIQLHNEGRMYRGVEHDSLVITRSKNAWYQNSRHVGGVGGWSFIKGYVFADQQLDKKAMYTKIRNIANKVGLFDPSQQTMTEEQHTPYVYPQTQITKSIDQAKNYLVNERKISPKLVDWLHQHNYLDQDKNNNVVFKRLDPFTGKIIGASKQGTYINFDKYPKRGTFKIIDQNTAPHSAWYFDIGKPLNVRFFEAPIDAMSFYQIAPDRFKNTRFIALDGLKPHIANHYLTITDTQLAQEGLGIQSIALGVDNDAAGDAFVKEMQEYRFSNNLGKNIPIKAAQPNKKFGKDWNDQLKNMTGQSNLDKNAQRMDQVQDKVSNKDLPNEPKDLVKTPVANLMKDVSSYLVEPVKTLELLDFLDRFHDYSVRNRLLIQRQRPGALAVGSFQKFKALGYSVKKGEKGIKILVPVEIKEFHRQDKLVPLKYATKDERAKIKAGLLPVRKKLAFTAGNVFDITQTTMPKEKYPELYPNRHVDFDIDKEIDQKYLDKRLDKFAQQIGFKVDRSISEADYSNYFGVAKGVTVPKEQAIYLNPNNTSSEQSATLMHELGHALLHTIPQSKESAASIRPIKELQAQLTSYLVAKNYGINNHDDTVSYIAGWTNNGQKLRQLTSTLQAEVLDGSIKAADKIINFIDEDQKREPIARNKDREENQAQLSTEKAQQGDLFTPTEKQNLAKFSQQKEKRENKLVPEERLIKVENKLKQIDLSSPTAQQDLAKVVYQQKEMRAALAEELAEEGLERD